MKKWMFIVILIVLALAGLKVTWDYLIPSQDIQKSFKNLKAEASGLDQGSDGNYYGSGAAFSFTMKGKKIICGPGWRIIER